jgi:uncharacterized membrane protein (DUF373 family)
MTRLLLLVSKYFSVILDVAVLLLLPLSLVALGLGFAKAAMDLFHVNEVKSFSKAHDVLITDVLSLFVVIELIKSMADYFVQHRLKLTFIVDAAIVFMIREIMIGLYQQDLDTAHILSLSAAVLVLGAVRVVSVKFSPTNGNGAH